MKQLRVVIVRLLSSSISSSELRNCENLIPERKVSAKDTLVGSELSFHLWTFDDVIFCRRTPHARPGCKKVAFNLKALPKHEALRLILVV